MREYNVGLIAGMAAGVIAGLIVVAILLKVTKTDGRMKCEYDERQSVIRGKGYKYGFFTFMICDFLYFMLYAADIKIPLDASAFAVFSIIMAAAVQIAYCIWNDAYFSLNENKTLLLISFAVIAFMNLMLGITSLKNGRSIENGVLNFRSANLFCGCLFLVIFAVLLLKKFSRSENRED